MPEPQQPPARVAVSGGAGFIGFHTVDELLHRGAQVLVIDDLSHASGPLPPGAELVVADVGSEEVASALASFRPQAVLHLATKGGVVRSLRDPVAHLRTSLLNSVAFFNAAIRAGARFIAAASSGGTIYGATDRLPAQEELPAAPASPYGASKAAEELYLASFGRLHGVSTLSLRYGNVYGPRQDGTGEAGLVAITCLRLLAAERPIIYGDGGQTRDFVFVEDVARANVAAIAAGIAGAVNIGTGRETSVVEIVSLLTHLAEKRLEPQFEPPRAGEVRRVCLDNRRAAEWLGWSPQVELAAGLERTFAHFRERVGSRVTAGG